MTPTPSKASARYVVISPVRDEVLYLEKTIKSMLQQSIRPAQWILVNDGSKDGTGEIIDYWASQEPWILAVHRTDRDRSEEPVAVSADNSPNRGTRALKAKEIEAFYNGYPRVSITDWEFLVKLDGDVGFEPNYFERCFAEFDTDPTLGIGGGMIWNHVNGDLRVESTPRFHVRGATKIYRRACWEAIGGVLPGAGWDTIDEVKANMVGWSTRTFDDLRVVHYRFTGAANGTWQNATKNGAWNYISGYHPLFMLLKCIKRIFARPYLVSSAGLFYGFLLGYIRRLPQVEDKSVIRYLRDQQLRRLSLRTTIWK